MANLNETKTYNQADLQAELVKLRAENDALKSRTVSKAGRHVTENGLTLGIGEKKGVSVYGLGRFPTTLYGEQWIRLAVAMPEVLAFIKANAEKLAVKAVKAPPVAADAAVKAS